MKKIIILILVLALAGFFGYRYVYQSHRDIQSEKATFTVDAVALAEEFSEDLKASSEKYLNKTMSVTGQLTEIEGDVVMLENAVYCIFDVDHKIPVSKLNTIYTIKGRCIGYDELLEVIKLDQSSIIKK